MKKKLISNSVGIVIPAYNEKENILKLIQKIRENLNCIIIVVDDSSDLETRKILAKKKIKNLKYFNRGKKGGRGSAVFFGFKKFLKLKKKELNCFIEMDADFSHNPNELKKNIVYFFNNSLDLLICSRYLKESKIINWSISRKILSRISNILARILLSVPVSDYTNGFRFYSKPAVKTIVSKCKETSGGFIILSEIILVLWKKNFKIREINTIFKNRVRGESSVNLKLIIESLIGLFKIFFLKKFRKV